ncbi:MAG: O-antigen ligase family protein [Devosia sp.]|uniref:O-antigen ligase family protein n=1 Tax=Devosia sp. TaxID=1871048 RepID=UPI001A3FDA9A|nr:O-antigen ligase family protein [Devosia sp.]MBL8598875.1 O-antigen ligase family protein [Devosia sp.]
MALADASLLESRARGGAYLDARLGTLLKWAVALWVFAGSVVITEPSPYELSFVLVLAVSLFAGGFAFQRTTLGLLVLWVTFIPFALVAAFQATFTPLNDALIFQAVTIFLFFTSYWVANYVAEAPQERMRIIVAAYTVAAVLSAAMGTLGYLGLIPGRELLTLYGRAKALFNDPNVFGPFLILPAMYALQRVLLGSNRRAFWGAAMFMVITVGVFASFSRAAWGHLAISAVLVYLLCFVFIAHAREKVRMLILALVGTLMIVVAIGGLLSIPSVQRLFEARAAAQSYDEGETGRFGRQGYAFELALENPWGIGPLEFRNLRVREEPHNSYVNVVHVYGWGGGFAFILLIGTTLWRGLSFVTKSSPNRLLLIPLVSVFVPLAAEAAIIDLDHWRHFFLVAGLIWGVTAGYRTTKAGEEHRLSALV